MRGERVGEREKGDEGRERGRGREIENRGGGGWEEAFLIIVRKKGSRMIILKMHFEEGDLEANE